MGLEGYSVKKSLLIISVVCGVMLFAGSAWPYFVESTNVGSQDVYVGADRLGNSGYQTELEWVRKYVPGAYFTESDIYDGGLYNYLLSVQDVEGGKDTGFVAFMLKGTPEYFFVKIGKAGFENGETDFPDHILFRNLEELKYGVIALSLSGEYYIKNVGAISHIGEIGSVPEPVTLILLGAGLIGLAGIRRFK